MLVCDIELVRGNVARKRRMCIMCLNPKILTFLATSFSGVRKGVDDTGEDMLPRVEVTAFKAVYAAPGTELEQQEELGPGYGGECGARVVTGKLLRVFNPSRHVSFAAPSGACGGDGDGGNETVGKTDRHGVKEA